MRSSAARAEAGAPAADCIAATAGFMAERGILGVVWLDDRLFATARHGALVRHIPIGAPLTAAVPAFIGLEDEIRALRQRPGEALAIPNVMVADSTGGGEKVNLAIYWVAEQRCPVLFVSPAVSPADLEYRLAAETRARAIAEAEVAAQARIVQRINQELEAANRDLQEFASVISHDLRAPLRGLRYAATDAKTALTAGDTKAAAAHLEQALGLSRRMGAMLTGLLDYALAGRKTDAAAEIDTGELVAEIAASVGADATQEIAIEGSWPTFLTVAEPLDLVLRNLLDNAVKHHDRRDGRIVLSAEQQGDALVVSVGDDGPGIDPAWHKAIFLPFKQIADAEGSDGAGIGLALVKKTVERFGGSIEVHSDPKRSRGTTFRVLWPRTLPA